MLCACHAVHAVLLTSNQSGTKDKITKKFAELLSEAVETVAVFSEPGWLLRLEGHVEDVPQMRKLHAELAQLAGIAGIAGAAGIQTLPNAAGLAGVQASRSFRSEYSQPDSTAGVGNDEVSKPDWRDDSDVLRGRLLELGGVAGLQTDTDCLLLKDLCRPGLEDVAFLELVDLELQVRTVFIPILPCCAGALAADSNNVGRLPDDVIMVASLLVQIWRIMLLGMMPVTLSMPVSLIPWYKSSHKISPAWTLEVLQSRGIEEACRETCIGSLQQKPPRTGGQSDRSSAETAEIVPPQFLGLCRSIKQMKYGGLMR